MALSDVRTRSATVMKHHDRAVYRKVLAERVLRSVGPAHLNRLDGVGLAEAETHLEPVLRSKRAATEQC